MRAWNYQPDEASRDQEYIDFFEEPLYAPGNTLVRHQSWLDINNV